MRLALLLVLLLASPAWAQYPRESQPAIPPERVLSALGLVALPDAVTVAGDTPVSVGLGFLRVAGTSESTCQAVVDRFNEINRNSLAAHVTVYLAGCRLIAQASSGTMTTDLARLYNRTDGWYDDVDTWAASVGADLVQMIVPSDSAGYAGFGYVNAPTILSALSVVVEQYAVGYMSGPHEAGHNWGMHHDLANAGGGGAYPYGYGWRDGTWRTVMAYAPGERIPYWSSPDVVCPGGLLCGTITADNAKVLRTQAVKVSGFRAAGSSTPRPRPSGRPVLKG